MMVVVFFLLLLLLLKVQSARTSGRPISRRGDWNKLIRFTGGGGIFLAAYDQKSNLEARLTTTRGANVNFETVRRDMVRG